MTQEIKDGAPAPGSPTSSAPPSQRSGIGTQMLRSLAGAGFDVQMKALTPRGADAKPVQKKAAIGANYTQPTDVKDAATKKVVADETPRRFKTRSELDRFASSKKADDAGEMKDGTWVRLDEMHVLGEHHGNPIAPDILGATGTRKFRYEAFAHHSATRLAASPALKANVEGRKGENLKKLGVGEAGADEPKHEAEHALPKYARTVADIKAILDAQKGGPDPEVKRVSVRPGVALPAEYSLVKALLDGFLTALLYAQSYGGKYFKHPLKAFYNAHQAAVDEAVAALKAAPNAVPDFRALAIGPLIEELTAAYETAAKDKLGMTKPGAVDEFKKKLDRSDEKKQGETDRASELDYLRDASMLQTIKDSKSAGDKLFVIGDAHRKKLGPEIDKLGIRQMDDVSFVTEQQQKNADTTRGVTETDRVCEGVTRKKVAARLAEKNSTRYLMKPRPQKVGDVFTLEPIDDLPKCKWVVEGADSLGAGRYKVTATIVHAEIMWTVGGASDSLHRDSVYSLRKPKGAKPDKTDKPDVPTESAAAPKGPGGDAAGDRAPDLDDKKPATPPIS